METHSGVLPIASAEQIPSTLLPELQGLLLKANQAHGPDRTEVANGDFERFCRIFFDDQDGWTSNMLPSIPVHRLIDGGNHGVIGPVGHFLEDLPLLEYHSLRGALANLVRKKNDPAFFKVEIDSTTGDLKHIFLDDNLNPVAAHLVACKTGTGLMDAKELADAILTMDYDVQHLHNLWNEDLAIYLWQVVLYNHTHPEETYDPKKYGHASYNEDSFIQPRRIRDVYKDLNNSNEEVCNIIESSRQMEFFVPTP